MKISACIIVKDDSELEKLIKCVNSIYPFVDGIYITSTGKQINNIIKFCDQNKNLHYSHLDWTDDFATTRNFNFSQAPQDSDYILWLDSDDIFVGGPKLREVAQLAKDNGKDVVFFSYWYGCKFNGEPSLQTFQEVEMAHMRERLIRPGTSLWKGRLHETFVPVEGAKNDYTTYAYDEKERPIAVMHTALDVELPEKMERNKRILEMQLEEERKSKNPDCRTILNLIKIYAEEEDKSNWEKAIKMGYEYLDKSGWDEERAVCWEQMSICADKLGKHKEVVAFMHRAIAEWEAQPLHYIRLATGYYNLKNYRAAKHWLNIASSMDLDNKITSGVTNLKAMKVMFAKLLLLLNYNAERDSKKALEAARLLLQELPTKENQEQVYFLEDVNDLNDACRNADLLARYLISIQNNEAVEKLLDILPEAISTQPFAHSLRKQVVSPRKWQKDEICYFANFGSKHFEKWDATSLSKGIGGSETAVIELAKQWTKQGYKVTIYGDPLEKGLIDGVNYLPWYHFNKNDSFNIFIQWRGFSLANKIKTKKFYVDLHDVYNGVDFSQDELNHIDKIMVKSEYHRSLAPKIPDEKFLIISNGI